MSLIGYDILPDEVFGCVIFTFLTYDEKNNMKYVSKRMNEIVSKYYHDEYPYHKILHDWYYDICDKYNTMSQLMIYDGVLRKDIIQFMSKRFLNKYCIILEMFITDIRDEKLLKNIWNATNIESFKKCEEYEKFFILWFKAAVDMYTMNGKKLWWKFPNQHWKDDDYHNFVTISIVQEYIMGNCSYEQIKHHHSILEHWTYGCIKQNTFGIFSRNTLIMMCMKHDTETYKKICNIKYIPGFPKLK